MTAPRVLTETLVVRDQDGHTLPPGRYVWRGGANAPVFVWENCRDVVTENVDVICESPTEAVFVSERTKTGPGTIAPTMNQWRNVRVFGNGHVITAFWSRATIDENNEHARFDCVSVYGCDVGWTFEGQQAKENLLTHCRFESGEVAVNADSGFQWVGGACAVAKEAIILTRVGDPVRIAGVGFEACERLLVTAGPTSDAQPIVLDSVRYAADQLHEDGAMIVMRHAGPLTVIGGSFGDGDQLIPYIQLAGVGEQTVNLVGAKFGSFGAADVHPVKVNPGVHDVITRTGCTYQTAASHPQRTTTLNTAPVLRA